MNLAGVINSVVEIFNSKLPSHYFYHNLTHSLDVLNATKQISQAANIKDEEYEIVCTAAILHDVGYVFQYRQNEPLSVDYAKEILPNFKYTTNQINVVCDCIMATVIPQKATNRLQMILCDADLDYLGRPDYFLIANKLRKEWTHQSIILTDEAWIKIQIDFLTNHSYYTIISQSLRNNLKIENINTLKFNNPQI